MGKHDTIFFGHIVLFHPRLRPVKINEVTLWTDNIPLGDNSCFLVESLTLQRNQKQFVLITSWIEIIGIN